MTIKAARQPDIQKRPALKAAVHILFEAAFIMNVVTVTVYWTVLHAHEIKNQPDPFKRLHLYNVHIIPGLSFLVNYMWLDIRLAKNHVKAFFVIALVLGVVNYRTTKAQGKPVYFFLTW